ncbi:MAG TPA: DUF6644 family protein [Steroidobacteraceae bacterium]|nr:DUF6644 family protein [Steroidobacteraceae bacterium]
MSVPAFVQAIYDSGVAEWMRQSLKAMPFVESAHVLAIATVFGTILIVDLRLLGWAGAHRPFSVVSREMLPKTWVAFAAAVVTGALMFAPNAITYYGNTAFRLKMLALVLAGLNMAVFHLLTARSPNWEDNAHPPAPGRVAAVLSIALWVAIIFLGRWIGFTKGYDFSVPEDVQFDFAQ